MIYLASPYSHPDPLVREARFDAACRAVADLIRDGQVVYSPVVQFHSLVRFGLPTDWTFWERHDQEVLGYCSALLVLTLDGWQHSVGVQAEIANARALSLPVVFLVPAPPNVGHTAAFVATKESLC